jgi:hypothetical protein
LPTGEVGKDVFESIAKNSLSVRFEINIVKVSFASWFGIWRVLIRNEMFRFRGCRCMGYSLGGRVEMGGSIR